ncbi:hypothetical protein GEMRC1_010815 [Eukaryota sp. GEM-RC1]
MSSRKRRFYTFAFKREVIETVRTGQISIRKAALRYGIPDPKTIRNWLQQEEDIFRETDTTKGRISGGGRPLTSKQHEYAVDTMILEQRLQHLSVSRSEVLTFATHLASEMELERDGQAWEPSEGWLNEFLSRNNWSIRRATGKPKLSKEELVERAVNFYAFFRPMIKPEVEFINFDETAIFIDPKDDTTLEQRGARDVLISASSFEKVRVTAIMAASSRGRKFPPVLIEKGDVNDPIRVENDHALLFNSKSWMTTDLLSNLSITCSLL